MEEVRLCALVGLASEAIDGDIAQPQDEEEDGNRDRKPAAPMLQRCGSRESCSRHRQMVGARG